MVLTMLDAKVDEKYWQILQSTYETMTKTLPPKIKSSYLVQEQNDKTVWKILTFWESQASLDAMRESGTTPTGMLIFKAAKSKPSLTVFNVGKSTLV